MALPKWGCHFLYVRCVQANILLQTRSRLDGRIAVLRRQNTPPKYRWVHTVWSSILPDLRSFTPNKRVHFVSITLGDVVAKAVAASTDKLHENLLSFLSFYGWQKDLQANNSVLFRSAPTFLSILLQNICKASEDFVYASCNCGALSEARRAELAGAVANRRINKIRKRSLFWSNIR